MKNDLETERPPYWGGSGGGGGPPPTTDRSDLRASAREIPRRRPTDQISARPHVRFQLSPGMCVGEVSHGSFLSIDIAASKWWSNVD